MSMDLAKKLYAKMPGVFVKARKKFGRGLTLAEKILVSHADNFDQQTWERGKAMSGGPASVYQDNAPRVSAELFALPVPFLGICYGMGLVNLQFGGAAARADHREYGPAELVIDNDNDLFHGFAKSETTRVWMSHGDKMTSFPAGWEILAHSNNSPIAAFADPTRRFFGLQFHPEVVHTARGRQVLDNFVLRICGDTPDWTMEHFIETSVKKIRAQVGDGRVLCALSGGVGHGAHPRARHVDHPDHPRSRPCRDLLRPG